MTEWIALEWGCLPSDTLMIMRTSGARPNDSCMWSPSPPLTNDILSFRNSTKYQVSHYAVDDSLGKLRECKADPLGDVTS
jgi:hypothetical protein